MRLNRDRYLYASTIFVSSALLFLLQPMMAKALLPRFGGSAGVWTACMLFFQVVLLAGYAYAYGITRYLGRGAQMAVHAALLIASLAMLPVNPAAADQLAGMENQVWRILGLLGGSAGLPYFMLSTTGPLVQAWYAEQAEARFPYRLFALSNLASLAALLAYPVSLEPLLSEERQLLGWSGAYAAFVLLAGVSAVRGVSRGAGKEAEGGGESVGQSFVWIALAACASTLWLAVANHLSQEVAAIPFLWVLPLGLYLLSFILCFDSVGWYRPRAYRWILPAAWVAMCWRLASHGPAGGFEWEILLYSVALFVCCMWCHSELARRKPEPRRGLTFFYLMIAAGGALGAVFVGLIAPRIFSAYLELPVGIAVCMILGAGLLYGYSAPRHLARLSAVAVLAFLLGTQFGQRDKSLLRMRNFYGTLQVTDSGAGAGAARSLFNGKILHGMQFLSTDRSRLPTTYYGPQSGAGLVLQSRRANARVGVIGLGAGTLAAYGRPGDYYRFYEINPAVTRVASEYFSFLRQSAARTDVVTGDGRLALEREPGETFDVLILDAFSGDSIPVHLLTKQAFEIYFRHLRTGGIIAVHITNKYLDLGLAVHAAARVLRKEALLIHSAPDPLHAVYEADWGLLAEAPLGNSRLPKGLQLAAREIPAWTDQYSNLFQILK
jgi:SAM-dependent methyltransferase